MKSAYGQFLEQSLFLEAIFSIKSGKLLGYGGYGNFFIAIRLTIILYIVWKEAVRIQKCVA